MKAGRLLTPFISPAKGIADVPGSKSLTNRALICAGLADGTSVIKNFLMADDTEAMIAALKDLGVLVIADENGGSLRVTGLSGPPAISDIAINARLSGTTSRFIVPAVAAGRGKFTISGEAPLMRRPFHDQIVALRSLGANISELGEAGCLPLKVDANGLEGGTIHVSGEKSSQFASGILMAAPLMKNGLTLHLEGAVVSRPYIELTLDVMRRFGAEISNPADGTYVVSPTGYQPADYYVEPDASAASYMFAAAAITGGTVRVNGLSRSSKQGDIKFVDVLEDIGATVHSGDTFLEVSGGPLSGGKFDLKDFSDTAQTLAAVAVFASAPIEIEGIGFIKAKETDRIEAMATELERCGVVVNRSQNGMVINPNQWALRSAQVETYDDHRMAMSMSLLSLRVSGIEILDPECVDKTFPKFFEVLESLRDNNDFFSGTTPVIAIDGPAGAGKSTIAKLLAEHLGVPHFDTGAMYRAVTLACLDEGLDVENAQAVALIAKKIEIKVGSRVQVDGVDVSERIRGIEVGQNVSAVAANSLVRTILVERQRRWAIESGGGVMEGRDIGTAVFPDAALKIFLTATVDVRAKRRFDEKSDQSLEQVKKEILSRDETDSSRQDSPLRIAANAVIVDTSNSTIGRTVELLGMLFRSEVTQ